MIVTRWLIGLLLVLTLATPASADVFLRVLAAGATTGGNQQAVTLKVTTPTLTLRVDAKSDGMSAVDLTGATVQYLLDGQPLSPSVAGPPPFSWTWTPPAGFKGVHTLQAKVTAGGPTGAVYRSFSTMTFGAPDLGPQRLPALSPFTLAGSSLHTTATNPVLGWYQYTGPPKLPSLPLRAVPPPPFPPPDPQALLTGSGWIIEPWTNAGHNFGQTAPMLCYEASGQPWLCAWYQQAGNLSAVAAVDVLKDLHTDGPRGTNAVSPYFTCVAAPDPDARASTCIDVGGRLYTVAQDGHVITLVGPWQACDSCPVQWRGDFEGGLRFNAPNDLSYDIIEPTLIYVADTYNHRIAKVDLSVSPPKITTLAGSGRGYLDGPGLTAKFNAPFSVINHGPHACPGRPEFADCVHIYVGDTMNKAIRILDLHRHGEIPNVITQLGGPTKGTDYTTAFANPTPWVQNCVKADCSINWPMVIRWDSEFNTIIGETVTGAIRRWNWRATTCNGLPSSGCLELITVRPGGKTTAMRGSATNPLPGWLWLDVDRKGEVGPKNDILWGTSVTSSGDMYRVSADGTRIGKMDGSGSMNQGQGRYVSDEPGHYFWAVWIAHGEIGTSGFGSLGMRRWRPYGPTDHRTDQDATVMGRGRTLMGQHPEVAVVHGTRGWNRLGVPTFDEVARLGDPDLFAQLRQWAPSLTDAQAKDWAYVIRWTSTRAIEEPILAGVAMGPSVPLPPPPPPQFTITLTKSGTGDGTLTGAGSFPGGTVPPPLTATPVVGDQFAGWSLCSTATTPSLTLPALTADVTCNAIFTRPPPAPPTIDGFAADPTSIVAGQSTLLTWTTSNTTAVTLNGSPVPEDGTIAVTPIVTTHYDLLAGGVSRRVTVTVTAPPPIEDRKVIINGVEYRIIEVAP